MEISEFLEKWSGFFANETINSDDDISDIKYEYLSNKYS